MWYATGGNIDGGANSSSFCGLEAFKVTGDRFLLCKTQKCVVEVP